jgi:hypothetical protein
VAAGVRDRTGGIWGLLADLERYGEPIEADLVRAGWTLDDVPERLNWRALRAFVRASAADRTSALHRALAGDDHVWGLQEQLQAATVDVLQAANWQRTGKKSGKPKPIPRPGFRPERRQVGTSAIPLEDAEAIFTRRNPAAFN